MPLKMLCEVCIPHVQLRVPNVLVCMHLYFLFYIFTYFYKIYKLYTHIEGEREKKSQMFVKCLKLFPGKPRSRFSGVLWSPVVSRGLQQHP